MQKNLSKEIRPSSIQETKADCSKQEEKLGVPCEKQSTPHQSRTLEKGFIMISMSLLIFLFTSIGIIGLGIHHYWKQTQLQKKNCIKLSLKKQRQITEQLNELIRLNPIAKSLHIKHRASLLSLAAAIASQNPVAIQVARRAVAKYKSLIKKLDAQQRIIIKAANLKLSLWHLSKRAGGAIKIAVIAKPLKGLAPQYSVDSQYLKKFAIWQKGTVKAIPLIKSFAGIEISKNWKWHCGASIEKRSKKWKPRLIEAKFFWSSLYS